MKLVIVESPTKAQTIQKFLGNEYSVKPCYGHIRDLPKRELGVDVEHNFQPKYVIPMAARKRVNDLKKALKNVSLVILASDEDREGEAIAWHLIEALKLQDNIPYQRIAFHEITKSAIENAVRNPRNLDINLVNAQQARRILDRLVGYKLSPFLWKAIAKGLSAGRVQSVALKLVVDREKEIENFTPQEYWTIEALLTKDKRENSFKAQLIEKDGRPLAKLSLKTKNEAEEIIKDLKNAEYKVKHIKQNKINKKPLPPFTTSTLQQEAWSKLKFSAKKTMAVAQHLYEKGLITYHRTDSLNLSSQSQEEAKKYIQKEYGEKYWPGFSRTFKTKSKNTQEAHEAIRPTYVNKNSQDLKIQKKLDVPETRLYDLIWRRFIASQMSEARIQSLQIDIKAKNFTFRSTGQTLEFDGFLKIYPLKFEENKLPALREGQLLKMLSLDPSQHFTQAPPRYSEATLIKALEAQGIGRPSTYAPILDNIQKRNYVQKDKNKKLFPTQIGQIIIDTLAKNFPEIIDIKFTSKMEDSLDLIAQGKKDMVEVLKNFYGPFEQKLGQKLKNIKKQGLEEKTNKTCPKCGAPLVIKWSKYGKFYACSNFPECKYTAPLEDRKIGVKCPKCKTGEIVEKRTKTGKIFYGCSNYPKCDFALWDKPTGETCPKCGAPLVIDKKGGIKCSNKECDYRKN